MYIYTCVYLCLYLIYPNNNHNNHLHNNSSFVFCFFKYLILQFFWFYSFIPENNANQCIISFLLKGEGEVTAKFEKFNLVFSS